MRSGAEFQTLRHLLEIQSEVPRRQLDTWVPSLVERSGLEM